MLKIWSKDHDGTGLTFKGQSGACVDLNYIK